MMAIVGVFADKAILYIVLDLNYYFCNLNVKFLSIMYN